MPLADHLDLQEFDDVEEKAAAMIIYENLSKTRERQLVNNPEMQKAFEITRETLDCSRLPNEAQELLSMKEKISSEEEHIRDLEREKNDLEAYIRALESEQEFYKVEKGQVDELVDERSNYEKNIGEIEKNGGDDAYKALESENKKLRLLVEKILSDEDFAKRALCSTE